MAVISKNMLRTLLDGDVPLVAVSFGDSDNERLAQEAKDAGVDIAELRIDGFSRTDQDHVLAQVRAFASMPVLATVRSAYEGGDWKGTEQERLALFRAIAPHVHAVDIELSSREILAEVVAAAHEHDTVALISYHNFDLTPSSEELEAVIADAKEAGADIVKLSTMATSADDVKRLAALLLAAGDDVPLIVIAMGAEGCASRVFFPVLGSRITYSFFGTSFAPGQLAFAETSGLLRTFHPGFDRRMTARRRTA
ncbi:type I 3-dehydroquinate dehydratase [Streptomyces sp. APSN-46.1]|uniref:type I 3-dehydroquinate dehydratase n=1 Tax=Streptomyces sp. APSN-46.1 TaxID=2929049 RepID=UPI001FB5437C|nr:type I 3-dehydroquinate dehydratase [Streptomyces sp. APSN-46.1]MCJ1678333.1 type I 3-dehydroquinate dehydratase [Streptomyces sp. APSN-46.1]